MPRHGVSESGIGCKDSENNDYLHVFRGLFFVTFQKSECLGVQKKQLDLNTLRQKRAV